jgi:hypothetical protein
MPENNNAIYWDLLCRSNDHDLIHAQPVNRDLLKSAVDANQRFVGEQGQQVLNGSAPSVDGQAFQNHGTEDKEKDEQGGRELPNREGGHQGNRHRKLHRHPPGDEIFERLAKNGIASAEDSGHREYINSINARQDSSPTHDRGDPDQRKDEKIDALAVVVRSWVRRGGDPSLREKMVGGSCYTDVLK